MLKSILATSSPSQFSICAHIDFFLLQLVLLGFVPIYIVTIYIFILDSNRLIHLLGPLKYSDDRILKSYQALSYFGNYLNVIVKEFY